MFKFYGIPGPRPSLLVDGNQSMSYKDRKAFEVEMENFKKYGPTWSFHQGDSPSIFTTDVALLKHVFLENVEAFSERQKPLMEIKMAHGILFCPRPRWKLFRRIMGAPFKKFTSRGQSSIQFVEDSVRLMIEYIEHKFERATEDGTKVDIDIYHLLKSNALYMISELAVKLRVDVTEDEVNVRQLDDHLEKIDQFLLYALIFPFLHNLLTWLINFLQVEGYMKVVYQALDKRLCSTTKKIDEELKRGIKTVDGDEPIVDTLIRCVHSNQITHHEFHGNAEALLFAGYDTTSTTLVYTLWCLSKYQDVQERLRDELLVHGTESEYLEQVLKESMRLYPVTTCFTMRLATKSAHFNGVTIPEGTQVFHNNYIMHRHPAYWKEPEKFDPDRFAPGNVIDPIYYAPFGLGERKCLGSKLAMLEMKIVLTELISRYKLTLESPQELHMLTVVLSLTKPADQIRISFEKAALSSK